MFEQLSAIVDEAILAKDVGRFALHDVRPGSVLEPRSADEAALILRTASENGWRVECAGGGAQPYGNRRTRADLVISTRALTNIVEYEPADLVIGVQAGMTLKRLQAETVANRQFLALDPALSDESTVGGALATSRTGPLRFAHGTWRDHVLGLQAITGDGRVLQVGGRVVKNVAGYDLVRLLVGSAGTLALITAAYVRLKPMPQADETVVITGTAFEPLLEMLNLIRQMNLEAQAVELIGPHDNGQWRLAVRLAANAEAVRDARARVEVKARELALQAASDGGDVWQEIAGAELGSETAVRLGDLPARMPQTIAAALKLQARIGAHSRLIAHAGDGIARVLIPASPAEETAFAIGETRALLSVTGGSVIVQSRSGDLMRRVDAFGASGPQLQLMASLKKIFDPAGILAPGRFVV